MSNSSLVSGLSEASGVKSTWSQGFQESQTNSKNRCSDVPSSPLKGPPRLRELISLRDEYSAEPTTVAELRWQIQECH